MKSHDSSCSVLYDLRSTQAISQFWELARSSSNLLDDAGPDLMISKLELMKQMWNNVLGSEWKRYFSSTQLQLQESSKCHGWTWWWQSRFFKFLVTISFNSPLLAYVGDESHEHQHKRWWILMKNEKKSVKRFWENWENCDEKFVRSEKWIVIMHFLLWLCLYTMP